MRRLLSVLVAALVVLALLGGVVLLLDGRATLATAPDDTAPAPTVPRASAVEPDPVRIWTVGDSITYGANDADHSTPGGYRRNLPARLADAGVSAEFVGTSVANPLDGPVDGSADGSSKGPVLRHDGWPGTRIDQLDQAMQGDSPLDGGHWLDAVSADVVVLMAGTNDIGQAHDPARPAGGAPYDPRDRTQRRLFVGHLVDRLEDLMATVWLHDDTVRLVVCTVPPSRYAAADPTTRAYNRAIRTQVLADARRVGVPVVLADVEAALTSSPADPTTLIGPDGIHPTDLGYDLVADAIAPAVVEAAALS